MRRSEAWLSGGPVASGRLVRGFVSSSLPECFLGEARKERTVFWGDALWNHLNLGSLSEAFASSSPPEVGEEKGTVWMWVCGS